MEEERKFVVYAHICPNGKRYIGMTSKQPESRWANGNGYKTNERFWTDIQLFGWDNIKHEILKENLTLDEACYWEKFYIKKYNTTNPEFGYNTTEGGEKPAFLGKHHKEETRRKHSEAMSGENNPMYGKQHTEKTKRKQSEIKRGENNPMYGLIGENNPNYRKQWSEESKKKQSERMKGEKHPMYGKRGKDNPNYGKKRSDETRKKMSEAQRGEKHPMYRKHHTEESKKKDSESMKGRKFWNNGDKSIRAYSCPDGFVPGRLRRKQNN